MKLIDIIKSIISENSQERFGLRPTIDVESMVENFRIIAGQSGSRHYVVEWAIEYAMEYPEITKQFKSKYKIANKVDFEKFIGKLQSKARSDVNKAKKRDSTEWNRLKTMDDLANIEKMALDQSAEWDRMIANKQGQ